MPQPIRRPSYGRLTAILTTCLAAIWPGLPDAFAQTEALGTAALAQEPDDSMGFNLMFLQGGAGTTNIRSLLGGTGATEGIQHIDLTVGRSAMGRHDVAFSLNPDSGDVEPCFTRDILAAIGINLDKLPEPPTAEAQCLRLETVIPQGRFTYDAGRLQLDLSVPQIFLTNQARSQIDETAWDDGVPAVWTTYNLHMRREQDKSFGRIHKNWNVNLTTGANLGPWRLRNQAAIQSRDSQSPEYTNQNTYLQRDLKSWKSQLTLGQSYTASPLFESVQFLGVSLASDESMRPEHERGYAPVIRGIADSNATVEVRQNGYLVYSTLVSSGPFEITNLTPSGSNGSLDITIIEANGARKTFTQSFFSPPLMVREGQWQYDLATGRVRLDRHDERSPPSFFSGSALYGMASNLTAAFGLQAAGSDYRAYAVGGGLNTAMGALSLDITQSHSRLGRDTLTGRRARLRFDRNFLDTGSRIGIMYERSPGDGYRTLADHLGAVQWADPPYFQHRTSGIRQRLDIYANQDLGQNKNLYLSAAKHRNADGRSGDTMSLGLSGMIRNRYSYHLSYMRTRSADRQQPGSAVNNSVTLTLNIPLGKDSGAPNLYSTVGRDGGQTNASAGLNGSLPFGQNTSYSLNAARNAGGGTTSSAFVGTTTSVGDLSAGYTHSRHSQTASLNMMGSVAVHSGGVNLGRAVGDSFALVKVDPPLSDVEINGTAASRTGRNGYAIVPGMTAYASNWVGISARRATEDVDFEDTMRRLVPTRGAVALAEFKADLGKRIQFQLSLPDGTPLPFGARVTNPSGDRIGLTDPRGRVLLLLPLNELKGTLLAEWDTHRCHVPYDVSARTAGGNYQRARLVCNPADQAQHARDDANAPTDFNSPH